MRYLLLFLFFVPKVLFCQSNNLLVYDIIRNNKVIGVMKLQKKVEGDKTFLFLNSEVNVNFIINNSIIINERSVYQNNKLIFSEAKRLINNREKLNTKIVLINDKYHSDFNSQSEIVKIPIVSFNLHLMYFNEPVNTLNVFSDSFQKMLAIDKIGAKHFSIELPDDGINEYFYENGKCVKVLVHGTFFEIIMKLQNPKQ